MSILTKIRKMSKVIIIIDDTNLVIELNGEKDIKHPMLFIYLFINNFFLFIGSIFLENKHAWCIYHDNSIQINKFIYL